MVVTEGGEKARQYSFIVGTIFVFIFACNYMALIPWSHFYELLFQRSLGHAHEIIPPTMDINTTVALALTAVGIVHVIGIKERGLAHFKHLFIFKVIPNPFALMEELARPFSLTVRLFANLLAHESIVAVLLWLTPLPLIYPVPIVMLGMITGLIQAYVFSLLTTNYLAAALQDHH
jgi:F-type H+-transporting ATPase subunit a